MIKDKRKYSGFPGDCSEEQLKALQLFRGVVAAVNGGKEDPRWDEVYLLRFLRARKFNLKETEKMWREHIAWRQRNKVDQAHLYYFPELLTLRKLFPHGYHKHTRNHCPIYIERLGMASPQEIWKVTTPDRLLAYYTTLYEELLSAIFPACTRQRQKDTGTQETVTQTCTILDLKDIKLTQASSAYKFVKPASEMAQNNYPEILGSMFIINAPFLFTGIWTVVKMWIDDKTKEKIHILGSGYKKELLKHIDPSCLPDFIDGGLCKCPGGCLGSNTGPWNPEGKELFPNCITQYQPQQKPAKEQPANEQKKLETKVEEEKLQEKVPKTAIETKEEAKVERAFENLDCSFENAAIMQKKFQIQTPPQKQKVKLPEGSCDLPSLVTIQTKNQQQELKYGYAVIKQAQLKEL